MLEVKNLYKTYRTKNGVVTNALDGVTLTFPETGMVFILGKSGSGKSTLLNVCGGLDKPDSGEIVIKGKSSRDFKTQDFDSYRNTYVGFVFQEYNVLGEFSVEENIAIALELQGKKRDKAAVDKILAEVDMREFAQRKPNTLSGGQKQRVAIARALVKSPEIIMADEPTGALDSATGKQVFDTLKKLSESKLVLVVSHDRDFAEQYGDRIIELKDGMVISDQVRSERDGDGAKQNVRFFGADTVSVENGAEITDEDMQSIKKFLQKSGGSAVISTSREHITSMKKDVPELDVGGFEEIPAQPESKTYAPQTLIRSKLPMRHAIRVGASGLKTKPVRLVFTILLSVAAFVMFGLASTLMLFNDKSATVSTLMNSGYDYIALNKTYYERERTYFNGIKIYDEEVERATAYTYGEYEEFEQKYGGAVAAVNKYMTMENVSMNELVGQFYSVYIDGVILANGLEMCEGGGRLPQATDETAISDYIFDGLKAPYSTISFTKINDRGEEETVKLSPEEYSDVLYSESNPVMLEIGGRRFKIVGVYKGTAVPDEYKNLKAAADENRQYVDRSNAAYNWIYGTRRNGMYARLAVTEELLREYAENSSDGYESDTDYFDFTAADIRIFLNGSDTECAAFSMTAKYGADTGLKRVKLYGLDGGELNSLAAGQIALPATSAAGVYYYALSEYCKNNSDVDETVSGITEMLAYISGNVRDDDMGYVDWYADGYVDMMKAALEQAYEYITELGIDVDIKLMSTYDSTTRDATLAGVYYRDFYNSCYLADDLYEVLFVEQQTDYYTVSETKYVEPEDAFISTVFVPYDGSRALTNELVDMMYSKNADDSSVTIVNSVMDQLELLIMIIGLLGKVFMGIGVVLALFAFLLMFNFISASIAAKKKEIGILRAIGARTTDVFKIFLSEAMIIVLSCFVAAVLFSFALCALLNFAIASSTFIKVSVFVFGPLSVLCVLGIALVTGVLATVIPVAVYGKKPPVDSIRAL